MVEQFTRNEKVGGSNPLSGSGLLHHCGGRLLTAAAFLTLALLPGLPLGTPLQAQEAPAAQAEAGESLPAVLAWVYQTNPELLAARQALAAQQETLSQVYSRWLPTLELRATGSASRGHSSSVSSFGFDSRPFKTSDIDAHSENYQLSISQNLFRSGADKALLDQQKALIQQQQALLASTEQRILLQAVTAYMDVIQGEEFLRLRAADVKSLDERWRQTNAQFEVGDRTRADLAQARSRFASATAQQLQDKDRLDTARATYTQVVNRGFHRLQPVTTAPELPSTLADALRLAQEINPLLAQQHWEVVAARAGTRSALRGVGPSLDLVGQLARQDQDSENPQNVLSPAAQQSAECIAGQGMDPQDFSDCLFFVRNLPTSSNSRDRVLQLTLTVPLYQGGALGGQIRQARRTEHQALYNLQAQQRGVVQQVTAAWKTLEAAHARGRALQIAVGSAEIALSGIRSEARVGQRTVADILDAQRDLITVQVQRAEASRDVIVAAYNLLNSIGTLSAERLDLDVELHDPQQNLRRSRWKTLLPPALELLSPSPRLSQ